MIKDEILMINQHVLTKNDQLSIIYQLTMFVDGFRLMKRENDNLVMTIMITIVTMVTIIIGNNDTFLVDIGHNMKDNLVMTTIGQ